MKAKKPTPGMTVNTPALGLCVVVRVYSAGTIDVRASNGRHYRITGLSFR